MNATTKVFRLLLPILLLISFLSAALLFSFHQNIWVDESTQLSGLSLSFIDVYRWLGGMIDTPFLVPSDRMPVLSYWLGMVWGKLFGIEPATLRWLSVVLVFSALLVTAVVLYKKQKFFVLLATLVFLCLSSNLIVNAVEIRAYALFFFFSAISILLYINIVESASQGKEFYGQWLLLAFVLALAINTHFFGLVLAGSLALTYLLTVIFSPAVSFSIKSCLAMALILLVAVVFIVFPVMASFSSQDGNGTSLLQSFSIKMLLEPPIKLIYRLVAHQTMASIVIVPWLAVVAVYGVIGVSLFRRLTLIKLSLLSILILGFSAVFLANIFLSSFEAMAPHYNIWMLPVLALLFAYSLADIPRVYAVPILAVFALLLGVGVFQLIFSGEKYAHNRFDQVEYRVEKYNSDNAISIIYKKSLAKTWFAGVYRFDDSIQQLIAVENGYKNLRTKDVFSLKQLLKTTDVLMVVSGRDIYSRDLVNLPVESTLPVKSSVYSLVSMPEDWSLIDSGVYYAQESAEILVYKKTP